MYGTKDRYRYRSKEREESREKYRERYREKVREVDRYRDRCHECSRMEGHWSDCALSCNVLLYGGSAYNSPI
jgi:hypothetical protein